MKKIYFIFLWLLLLFPSLALAQDEKKKALYFYSESCSLCEEVNEYFSSQGFYEKYEIKKIEVSGPYNLNYLNEFFDVFGVNEEKRGWPAIVFGSEMLIGSQSIKERFSEKMEAVEDMNYPIPLEVKKKIEKYQETGSSQFSIENPVSFSMLLGASLIDSVSPCSFAVIVVLLNLIFFVGSKRKGFFSGLAFIVGVYGAYLLVGIGFSRAFLNLSHFSKIISISMGIISIIIGIFGLKNVFPKKKFFGCDWELFFEKSGSFFRKIFNPWGSFVLGFFSVFFLLPCASRPYLSTAKIFSLDQNLFKTIMGFILYNFIFLLPMVAIFLLIFGIKNEKMLFKQGSKLRFANEKLIRITMSAIMFFVGVYLIQNWI